MNVSPHFTLAELTRTSTGLDNTPTTAALIALCAVVWQIAEPLRVHLGQPVRVTSGYRSPAVNAAVGGEARSQHVKGEAIDVKVRGMTAEQIRDVIVDLGLPFDQLITYAPHRGGHVHISYAIGRAQRGQVLHKS